MPSEIDTGPRLVVVGGGHLGDVIAIPPGLSALVLGRSGDTVILGDPSVIPVHHGTLDSTAGQVRLTGSGRFGVTAVNGVAQSGTCELNDGDTFNLGNLTLRFRGAVDARYVAGRDLYAAGRDIHHTVRTNNNYRPPDPSKGPGRPVAILGGILCLIGFAVLTITFLSSINAPNPPSTSPIVLGFVLFFVGMITAGIGNTISKVAREKAQNED